MNRLCTINLPYLPRNTIVSPSIRTSFALKLHSHPINVYTHSFIYLSCRRYINIIYDRPNVTIRATPRYMRQRIYQEVDNITVKILHNLTYIYILIYEYHNIIYSCRIGIGYECMTRVCSTACYLVLYNMYVRLNIIYMTERVISILPTYTNFVCTII